ncbi:conserved hypothetical protein [Methylomarinovum caldicuralii]|uniref:KANL3/Tex30 alpha/beta hydrolase-like domain-containing protein n=1 Tax=Methylomarinovum caldicuralii TaxID=438856 RepID=A0AAU9BY98_9GAMM|nr:alpha/beta family hydrolase [Methylomarinovum caldicuralii]BCX81032.1 conserved hypothetical protein [Methylomarinovum caldicuralii]
MNRFERKIQVTADKAVTSVWAVPDGYDRRRGLILAHGAGAGMDHPFITFVHEQMAARGLLSVKFNFSYMEAGRKAPDRAPLLQATWKAVIDAVRRDRELAPRQWYLAGKSMGGRIASLLTAEGESCDSLIFLGYPLHPPGKPEKLRADHLPRIPCPMLFIQGDRDRLCDLDRLRDVLKTLTAPLTLHVIEGGDHSFKVPKRAGRTEEAVWREIVEVMSTWISRAHQSATTMHSNPNGK